MLSKRQLFINHVAQTSELSLQLEIENAKGMYIYTTDGRKILDLNSGISVSSLGHCHPIVVEAVKDQVARYMHTMVYGEHVQEPQIKFATLLSRELDNGLDNVYFLNGGSEAVEASIKLSRRFTERNEIIACRNAYHGSTLGAESLRSDVDFIKSYVPGVPGIKHITFNELSELEKISCRTAAVILEPVQAESGVNPPMHNYLQQIRTRCDEVGALMVLDEIQTGFGRTGFLFAHQKYGVIPDILLIGKSMGGGMPISGMVSRKEILAAFTKGPALGHITTFGGHPVVAAAAFANLSVLTSTRLYLEVEKKEALIKSLLVHPIIREIRSSGLMMGVELTKRKYLKHVVNKTLELGAIVDYFLFNNRSFRLAPPLIIDYPEIEKGCMILLQAMDYAYELYKK